MYKLLPLLGTLVIVLVFNALPSYAEKIIQSKILNKITAIKGKSITQTLKVFLSPGDHSIDITNLYACEDTIKVSQLPLDSRVKIISANKMLPYCGTPCLQKCFISIQLEVTAKTKINLEVRYDLKKKYKITPDDIQTAISEIYRLGASTRF